MTMRSSAPFGPNVKHAFSSPSDVSWTAPLCLQNPKLGNPKRKRWNCRKMLPRLRFGLRWDAKVALSHEGAVDKYRTQVIDYLNTTG